PVFTATDATAGRMTNGYNVVAFEVHSSTKTRIRYDNVRVEHLVPSATPSDLVLTNARLAGGQFAFDVVGGDATVVIQRSASPDNWADVGALGSSNVFQENLAGDVTTYFYRARRGQAPVAGADAYTLGKNGAVSVAAPGVLGNDTSAPGSTLTSVLGASAAHGSLTLTPDGSFSYTPASNYFGADSFTYRASDGFATSELATVSLTVTNINAAPVAGGDAYTLGKNATLNVSAPGLLANDTDPDDDPLTAQKLTDPAHGSVTVQINGAFTYTPATDYVGEDSFTYQAHDGTVGSGAATVSLTITNALNAPPAASNDVFAAMESTALVIPAGGVLTNDSDPDGNILTALLVSGPTNGTLSLSTNGGFTYTPATRYFGPDSFTYRATDGSLTSAVATASLNVAMAYSTSGSNVLRYGVPFEWRGANKMDVFGGSPADLTRWGMDIVREPIDMLLTTTNSMQTIVNNARAAGKVTILCAMWYDNDALSGGTTPYPDCQLLGANPTSDSRWAAVTNRWREIANQFKGQSDVWFDLWNEPYWWDDSHGYSDALWLSDMSLLVDNVRSTGARNICLVPGSATGQGHQVFINQGANLRAGRSNILFQIHCYVSKWDVSQATAESRFQAVLNAGCPLLIGEYGAGDPFANILSAARNKKVSTVAWLWKSSDSDNEALLRANGITPNDVSNNSLGSGVRAFCLEQRNGATGPAAPTGLGATAASSTRINLAWTDNATNESGYTVERSTDGVAFVPIVNLSANTTSYANTGLTSATLYYYRVIAYTPTGGSAYSNIASATTQ
ncbi:MAG: Ig-like domain-containing protein, partial [Verrucomicrobia bacterium]|nr:Ig-like domain-containing protein [Verrucomicrobiota bacterium]